ncbi:MULTISPECIES: hypothetical protein [unclassified Arthrobacter]|uniref:hypothetical protein n=1 Tax=unclassified Arthrobacter TaxID=235627 RepID=UPI0011B01B23|nr:MULTISPECIES: hypothetical protein [unclassified Arthrobacter]
MSEEDYALEFFADRGNALTAKLVATAASDESVGKIVRQWLRNWLINANDQTAMGALRDRVEKRLQRDKRFEKCSPAHFWKLTHGPSEAAGVDVNELKRVANKVYVTFFVATNSTVKRVQLGRAGELELLLEELFLAAGGGLHVSVIVQVLAHRFPHILDPQRVEPPDSDEVQYDDEAFSVPSDMLLPEEQIEQRQTMMDHSRLAAEIYGSLSSVDRRLLLVLDDPPAAAAILGCGRSSAYVRLRELRVKLLERAGNEPEARLVLAEVLDLSGIHEGTSVDDEGLVLSDSDGGQST